MRKGLSTAYSGLGYLIVLLGVVQFFLAGLGIFGAESFSAHETVGYTLHTFTIIVFLLAIAGPRTGRDIGMGFVLAAVTTLQISLPGLRGDEPWLAAFHPVLALAVLGLAAHIGQRYIGSGARGSGARLAASGSGPNAR
jgi:hypothetical protein